MSFRIRRVVPWAVAVALLVGLAATGRADGARVALLPLGAPDKLSIYARPVAAQVARTLGEAKVEVHVASPESPAPERVALVIEGEISGSKRRVAISLRLRAANGQEVLAAASASERSLAALDRAAVAVARELLPAVQEQLARAEAATKPAVPSEPRPAAPPSRPAPAPGGDAGATRPVALVTISADASQADQLHLAAQLGPAARRLLGRRWQASTIDVAEVTANAVLAAVATSQSGLGLGVGLRSLEVSAGPPYVGRASARVVVTAGRRVVFDRVVVTDSVVGKRKGDREQLLAAIAAELIEIARPRISSTAALGAGAAPTVAGRGRVAP